MAKRKKKSKPAKRKSKKPLRKKKASRAKPRRPARRKAKSPARKRVKSKRKPAPKRARPKLAPAILVDVVQEPSVMIAETITEVVVPDIIVEEPEEMLPIGDEGDMDLDDEDDELE